MIYIFQKICKHRSDIQDASDWLVALSPGSFLPSDWLKSLPLGPNLLPGDLPSIARYTDKTDFSPGSFLGENATFCIHEQ